jgi:hypothetical protein
MTRRDWWLGVAVLAIAIMVHAILPRYEWRQVGNAFVRIDRWFGAAAVGQFGDGRWAPYTPQPIASPAPRPMGQFTADDIDAVR